MKKRNILKTFVIAIAASMMLSSCIGSFALSNKVLRWNKQVGSKFLNELVFVAFWILPVYEVAGVADLLVINSIEFWSGKNPMTASTKVINTENGRYLVKCDGKGYDITEEYSGYSYRIQFKEDDRTWSLLKDNLEYPIMTIVDDSHVKMPTGSGDFIVVETSPAGIIDYQNTLFRESLAMN